MRYFLPLLISVLTISGCAIGPLISHETARTVGKNNHEFIGGYGLPGITLKYNYGLSDNIDVGLHIESLSIGLRAKYAFINNKEHWSWSAALGFGDSLGGNHYYGDITGSYLDGKWEPYGTIRLAHIRNDPYEIGNDDTGEFSFTLGETKYSYGQLIFGTRYWLDRNWLLSVEASSLFSITSGLGIGQNLIAGAAIGYRF